MKNKTNQLHNEFIYLEKELELAVKKLKSLLHKKTYREK